MKIQLPFQNGGQNTKWPPYASNILLRNVNVSNYDRNIILFFVNDHCDTDSYKNRLNPGI